jgi:hypothetical protein
VIFPELVTGEPAVKNAGGDIPTDVTVPAPEEVNHFTPSVVVESATSI